MGTRTHPEIAAVSKGRARHLGVRGRLVQEILVGPAGSDLLSPFERERLRGRAGTGVDRERQVVGVLRSLVRLGDFRRVVLGPEGGKRLSSEPAAGLAVEKARADREAELLHR